MNDDHESEEFENLRRVAEEHLSDGRPEEPGRISEADALALLHELQVHQIELELQNEELQRAREELEERVEQRTQELRETNARLASVLESITDCHFSLDCEWRFLEINPAAERVFFQRPAEELLEKVIWQEYPQAIGSEFYRKVILAITEHRPVHFEDRSWIDEHRWFEGHAYPRPDRFEVYLRDITERIEAEARQREFYRKTILAATQGKLMILDRDEVHALSGPALKRWDINSSDDIGVIREDAVALAESMGMYQLGVHKLTTCVVESISNVLKHAGSGKASLHNAEDGLLLLVEDNGNGIRVMDVPDVALLRGYSTAGTLGMGYKLMIASSRKVYLATSPDGTSTACEVPFHNDDAYLPVSFTLCV